LINVTMPLLPSTWEHFHHSHLNGLIFSLYTMQFIKSVHATCVYNQGIRPVISQSRIWTSNYRHSYLKRTCLFAESDTNWSRRYTSVADRISYLQKNFNSCWNLAPTLYQISKKKNGTTWNELIFIKFDDARLY